MVCGAFFDKTVHKQEISIISVSTRPRKQDNQMQNLTTSDENRLTMRPI